MLLSFLRRPDTDLVTATEAARNLGISRNDISKLPLKRYPIKNSFYYLVKDVRNFQLEKADDPLLLELQTKRKKSRIKASKPSREAKKTVLANMAENPFLSGISGKGLRSLLKIKTNH